MPQQTSLSVAQLLEELKNPRLGYPRCLIINEVGEVAREGEEEPAQIAKEALRGLLSSLDESDKYLAVCYLTFVGDLTPESGQVWNEFVANPDNARIVSAVMEAVEQFR